MPLPTTKSELLSKLQSSYEKLDAECEGMSSRDARRNEIEGEVSPCDLLAYQIGWGRLLLQWEGTEQAGETPDMPANGYRWNQLGELAQSFYDAYRKRSLAWLRREYGETVKAIQELINDFSDADLFTIGARRWAGEKWPIVKWIQVNTIAPYGSARTKIRRWKKSRSNK